VRSPRSDTRYSVAAPATDRGLTAVHDLLDRVRDEHAEFAAIDRLSFRTAIAEIVANVIDHAGLAQGSLIELDVVMSPNMIGGCVTAAGRPVEYELPDSVPLDAERGRGLLLATQLCDIRYDHVDGVNSWRVTRVVEAHSAPTN
jgi:serine/threonine-protein kinase RsbW